jgi:acetolactate decarboxylase
MRIFFDTIFRLPMKSTLLTILLLLLPVSAFAASKDALPPSVTVRYYGNFKKMIQDNEAGGVVELDRALSCPHIYALGVVKNAEGEITVLDGDAWVNYGKDGINKTTGQIRKGEKAALLLTACVEKWQTIVIPADMPENELHAFVVEQARKSGLNVKAPFPFLIEGKIKKVVWEVLDGFDTDMARRSNQMFLRKLVGYRDEAPAVLLGFYPAEMQNEFNYPGELWHIHLLFKDDNNMGHVNAFSVVKGSRLGLPASKYPQEGKHP